MYASARMLHAGSRISRCGGRLGMSQGAKGSLPVCGRRGRVPGIGTVVALLQASGVLNRS